jgi:hypothetical protein
MVRSTSLAGRFGIASLSLLIAIAVYCFARFYPPNFLEPFQATNLILVSQNIDWVQSLGPHFEWAPLSKVKLITNITTAPREAP